MNRSSIASAAFTAVLVSCLAGTSARAQPVIAPAVPTRPLVRLHVMCLDIDGTQFAAVKSVLEASVKARGADGGLKDRVSLLGVFENDEIVELIRSLEKRQLARVSFAKIYDDSADVPIGPPWKWSPDSETADWQTELSVHIDGTEKGPVSLLMRYDRAYVGGKGVPAINSGPHRQVWLYPTQTVVVETHWNHVPDAEEKRLQREQWGAIAFLGGRAEESGRAERQQPPGPRRVILMTPELPSRTRTRTPILQTAAYAEPVRRTQRVLPQQERTQAPADSPRIATLARAAALLEQAGHGREADAVQAEINRLRQVSQLRDVAWRLAEKQQQSVNLGRQIEQLNYELQRVSYDESLTLPQPVRPVPRPDGSTWKHY